MYGGPVIGGYTPGTAESGNTLIDPGAPPHSLTLVIENPYETRFTVLDPEARRLLVLDATETVVANLKLPADDNKAQARLVGGAYRARVLNGACHVLAERHFHAGVAALRVVVP